MDVPGSFRDQEAERRARRTEQRRKQRQVERESTDPEIVARRQARAEQVRLKARAWRAQETPEERARRLATMRVYQARRHSLETPQQREARLEAHRIVLREARKRKAEQNARLHASATNCIDNPLGYICSVCDRLCHLRDIVSVNETWVPVLEQIFPEADVTTFSVCTTCQGSLRKGRNVRKKGQECEAKGSTTDVKSQDSLSNEQWHDVATVSRGAEQRTPSCHRRLVSFCSRHLRTVDVKTAMTPSSLTTRNTQTDSKHKWVPTMGPSAIKKDTTLASTCESSSTRISAAESYSLPDNGTQTKFMEHKYVQTASFVVTRAIQT
ncbi:uncharacterized protein [Dermacentor andersoni]|uniref:uncharacterized protein n=1 Tax=Dermacentor andersoni TaxID=34620 RepID=UPI0021556AA1|nr:uncharacterized protein LOC126537948 [Dermacentor andersoni]XP_054930537.1 uncharacterized protein LOC126537948 [Dermacentor andersoni]